MSGQLLVAFDPDTGEVARAVRIKDAEPILPYHFQDGRIWVYRWDAVVALDAVTLDVQSGGWGWIPFDVRDETTEVRASLSAAPAIAR